MSFIPQDEIRSKATQSLAPMIDFLFIMLMFFASLAISRVTTRDTEVQLVKIQSTDSHSSQTPAPAVKVINISINEKGEYNWVTEIHDYPMETADAIGKELAQQYQKGLLPEDKSKTQVLLRIDKQTQWEPILKLIFAIRDQGFEVRPIFQVEEEKTS